MGDAKLNVESLEDYGLLSVEDAARRKGVHPETIRSWLRKGLPVVPVGHSRNRTVHLVPIKALDAFTPNPQGRPPKDEKKSLKKSGKKSRNL